MSELDDLTARRALSIAAALATAGAGERAEARRMDGQGAPIFWRQAARLGLPVTQEAQWLRFTRLLALLTPAAATVSIHDPGEKLGAVLAKSELSEPRLARLLAARGETRLEALERAIRMVARRHPKMDVVSLARFVLGQGGNALARDYYTQLDRANTVKEEETQHG